MKKISLTILGMFAGILLSFSQSDHSTDSSVYKPRVLSFDEANLVTSYYHQEGNHSAVTGGIGTEKLSDFANYIDVKLHIYDKHLHKHTLDIGAGVDYYTSASSDNVNAGTTSSASTGSVDANDVRIYPSVSWTMENEKKGNSIGSGISFSREFDYTSFGTNLLLSKKVRDKSGEISVNLQAYLDKLKLVIPSDLSPITGGGHEEEHDDEDDDHEGGHGYPTSPRRTISTQFSYTQIINERLQMAFLTDLVYQQGYLGLPFHRVYFNDNSLHQETLPDKRFKIPVGIRANYFAGDRLIIRGYYRYYYDTWGLSAHTVDIETPIKITPFLSLSPFYRFYTQSAVKYFAPYKQHTAADQYYTSNYDLSTFMSHFMGLGLRIAPTKGGYLGLIEMRYGHYLKNSGMRSNIVSLNLKFK